MSYSCTLLHFPNHQTNSKAQIFQIESTNMNNHKATRSAQNLIETPRSKPEKQHHGHRKHHHGSKCLPSKAWPLAIKPGALIWCACSIKSNVWSIPSQPSHGKCHQVGSNHCSLCIPHPCSYFPAQSNPKTKLGKISKRELATYLWALVQASWQRNEAWEKIRREIERACHLLLWALLVVIWMGLISMWTLGIKCIRWLAHADIIYKILEILNGRLILKWIWKFRPSIATFCYLGIK